MLNPYQYHANPKTLAKYEQAKTQVPDIAWVLTRTLKQKQALEHLWAQYPKWAFTYAHEVLQEPWPPGSEAERVIAQDAKWAYAYAKEMLHGPWPEAEPAIARKADRAYLYARWVLGLPKDQARNWGADYLKRHGSGPHQPNA